MKHNTTYILITKDGWRAAADHQLEFAKKKTGFQSFQHALKAAAFIRRTLLDRDLSKLEIRND
jgi:signal recognition particle GTPase